MMRCMLTEYLSAIFPAALKGFSKNRVEGFILASAYVQTAQSKCDDILKSLEMIVHFCSFTQEFGSKWPYINYSLYWWSWLKYFNRERDVSDGQTLQKCSCQLSYNIHKHSFLSLHSLFINTHKTSILHFLKSFQNIFLLCRQWCKQNIFIEVLWRWCFFYIWLPIVHERVRPNGSLLRQDVGVVH